MKNGSMLCVLVYQSHHATGAHTYAYRSVSVRASHNFANFGVAFGMVFPMSQLWSFSSSFVKAGE